MIPSSSPLSPSNGFPFSSSPFSSSTGPTFSFSSSTSTSSSVFGPPVTPPFGNFGPPFSNSNGCSPGKDNADSFNEFQVPTSGTSLSSSTPEFGRSPFEFTVPSKIVSTPFSGSSSTSSAMQSFSNVRSSVPTFGFFQSSQTITNANAEVASAVGGFSQPDVKTHCGGSLKASYCRTCDRHERDSNSTLVSISAMAVYCDKSHEELRLEDYRLRNEGYLPFGNQQTQPISGPTASQLVMSRHETFGFPPVYSFTEPLSSASRCDASSFPLVPGVSRCGTFSIPPVSSSTASVFSEKPSSSDTSLFKFYPATTPASIFVGHSLAKDVNSTPSSGDFGQFHDQCRGTQIAPYDPTADTPMILMSISAMFVYHNKSHDELRLEDYQQRNMVKTDLSNQQPSSSGNLFAPWSSTSNPFKIPPVPFCVDFITTSAMGNLSTGASSSTPQDKSDSRCTVCKYCQSAVVSQMNQSFNQPANQFGPLQNGSGSTSNTFPGPSQVPTVGFIVQPFGLGTAYGASPLTGFVNFTVPNIGAFGSSNAVFGAQQLIPMSWTPLFSFPALFTNAPAPAEIMRGTSVGPGGHNEKETQPTRSECVPNSDNEVNDTETVANSLADVQIKGKEKADSCVPEGLHIIVEKLGFNPWAEGQIEGAKLDFSRCILPCEEAEKDEDIFALAQFAVEQHNAMTEEGKVEIVGVIGASLEPVKGGRYHIVLEARDAINGSMLSGEPKRYYASVLRHMNHLAVLEKWLPGNI